METTKKYELSNITIEFNGVTLYRIKALKDFSDVKAGDLGGWVEKEDNLSQSGDAWIGGDAKVYGTAMVYDNAIIYGQAKVYGKAEVFGNAEICGDAEIASNSDYIVFKNWWSSGRYFTWTRSNNMWKVGCFYGTSNELIEKAYRDSNESGKEYERVVKYIESMLKDNNAVA